MYEDDEPISYEEAVNSCNKVAMNEDYDAFMKNQTWEMCTLPENRKLVDCKRVKSKPDGTIDRFKARLVARGFTQVHDIDYSETRLLSFMEY